MAKTKRQKQWTREMRRLTGNPRCCEICGDAHTALRKETTTKTVSMLCNDCVSIRRIMYREDWRRV